MRNVLTLVICFLLLQSCDSGKSKDELLTQDTWILFNRSIETEVEVIASEDFHDKYDPELSLKFHRDGTLDISENKNRFVATIRWSWKDEEMETISLDRGRYAGDYFVIELSNREFEWSKFDNEAADTYENFKHYDAYEWDYRLSPEEVIALILVIIIFAIWLLFAFFKIRKWLSKRMHSLMLTNAKQVSFVPTNPSDLKEIPSRTDLQFIEKNRNTKLEVSVYNRNKIIASIKRGFLVQYMIDLVFIVLYLLIADILSQFLNDDLEGLTNDADVWFWVENYWNITDQNILREIWIPIIIVVTIWSSIRYVLTINRFHSYKNKFYSKIRPLWNFVSFLFTSRWQNLFFALFIIMGIGFSVSILLHLRTLENRWQSYSIFYVVLFGTIVLFHFLITVGMKIRGRKKRNLKLLILRVFGEKEISQNTFNGLARVWKNFGSYFTVFDPTVYEIAWKNKYNSNLPFYLLITLAYFSIWGFLGIELFNFQWTIMMVIGILGIPVLINFYNLFIIKRDAISNSTDLNKRLRKLQKWPTELDFSFKEVPMLCYNDTWKMAIDKLTSISNVILMDLRGFSESNRGCEYEVDFLFDKIHIEKILFITDSSSLPRIKHLLNDRWAMLLESSPNLKNKAPKVAIYLTTDLSYNDKETQDMIDILLDKAVT